jgi:surface protein
MGFMFAYCSNLTSLDLSSFDTSRVYNMDMMFYNDVALKEINLSGWDLRNVASKQSMFGSGVYPSKVIMNGCDCDTILFIRQQIQNNGVDHTKVVQTDTVCPTYETSSEITYNIHIEIPSCAYNQYVYPDGVEIVTNITDEYGVSSVTSNWMAESDYTVKFELQEGGGFVEGDNETSSDRNIVGVVYYNGEYIGEYAFTQKAKPTDSSNTLSCDFDKSAQITDLYFDMDNLPEEMGYWWVGFSFTPNREGDCNNCDWSNGDLRICLYENRYEGIMDGEITQLEQINGLYHLHLDTPLYFICGEQNSHLERYYLTPDKSAPCGDTISFTSDSSSQTITINERAYDFYNMNDYTETDGKYVFNKSVSELTNGDINSSDEINSMRRMFQGCTRIISIDNLPCTSNVTNMSQMFSGCYNLTSLNLSNFDTSNVTGIGGMFRNCSDLTSLNLNGWKLNDNIGTSDMFNGCGNLIEIYLKNSDETTYMKIQDSLNRSGINAEIITK